ncbi:hypothetical protein JOC54_000188 [Alkalihalobacillus xiaoxiensis]|uniref:DUF1259 domain-containing protein n=1 Tax=Shouchella xiaoxiensis TaxID=766895 RepID=A0ABS2SN59_9BACI|nr:hypothetical protein [Shouchella xiaoxiensis]
MNSRSLCEQCAQIVNGTASIMHGVCSISIPRQLTATIQGRPTKGAIHAGITFESIDAQGNALNLGEFVVTEKELHPFTQALMQQGILISAIHNHWIFSEPNLLYVHFQAVEPPIQFAQKAANALHTIQF